MLAAATNFLLIIENLEKSVGSVGVEVDSQDPDCSTGKESENLFHRLNYTITPSPNSKNVMPSKSS